MKRTRWTRRLVGGLLALATLGGCKQQLFLEPQDYDAALKSGPLAKLETEPYNAITPKALPVGTPPATVLDPSRPPRNLTLKEAIAIALEQGTPGQGVSLLQPGNVLGQPNPAGSVTLPGLGSRGRSVLGGVDSIQAFALDPSWYGAELERSVSKFDARWINSITWNKQDQPTLTLQQSFSNGDSATLSSTLAKPLPTGGVAGITFSTNYLSLANPPQNTQFVSLATSYTPRLQFVFEQPLLQGFGVEINQLLPSHPGSLIAIPGLRPSGGTSEGILLTRIRHDQARAEFDRQVNQLLMNVESAYWTLYASYYNLAAQEEGLKQSVFAYAFFREREKQGVSRKADVYQLLSQAELFRSQVVTARAQVLSAERQLRELLGMRSDDGTRLVPVDEPTVVPYTPDYYEMANEALQDRPELAIIRQDLKSQQLNLIMLRNLRRPDLRFFTSYDIAGLGQRLDGTNTAANPNVNALQNFAQDKFNSWQLGLRLDMPIGFRDANAQVWEARLSLWRQYYELESAERKTLQNLTDQYRVLVEAREQIRYRRAQRVALEEYARLIRDFLDVGDPRSPPETVIQNVIQAQRDLAAATAQEFQAVANYNIALAGLEWSKGTIQQYNNVAIGDGPLPPHVGKKAADHFKAREAALKLREHPADLPMGPLYQWQPSKDILTPGTFPPPPGAAPPAAGVPAPANTRPWEMWQPGAPAPVPLQPETAPAPKGPTTTTPGGPAASAPALGSPGPVTTSPATQPPPEAITFSPVGTLKLPPPRSSSLPPATPTASPPTVTPEPSSGTGLPVAVPLPPR